MLVTRTSFKRTLHTTTLALMAVRMTTTMPASAVAKEKIETRMHMKCRQVMMVRLERMKCGATGTNEMWCDWNE